MLVNIDHKYPLYCNQPECKNKKEMDNLKALNAHLLFHENHSDKLSNLHLTSQLLIVNQQPDSLAEIHFNKFSSHRLSRDKLAIHS